MLRWIVMLIAAAVVLGYLWLRNRNSAARGEQPANDGVADEMAEAFGDVGEAMMTHDTDQRSK